LINTILILFSASTVICIIYVLYLYKKLLKEYSNLTVSTTNTLSYLTEINKSQKDLLIKNIAIIKTISEIPEEDITKKLLIKIITLCQNSWTESRALMFPDMPNSIKPISTIQ